MLNTPCHIAACLATAVTAGVIAPASAQLNYLANGGFETPGVDSPALGWQAAAAGYSLSSDARTGDFALQLSSPQLNAAVALQNSVEGGLQDPLIVGDTPTLSFWARGFAGTTGNVGYALRYLDADGNILADTGITAFQDQINPDTYTQITLAAAVVPVNASAAFIEFSQAIGPIDDVNLLAGTVLIDDVELISSIAIPEPTALALLGLGGLSLIHRRRLG